MVIVGTIENIAIIVIAFDFCISSGHDQIDPGRDIASLDRDISSRYVLEVFFNLAQFGPSRDHDFRL